MKEAKRQVTKSSLGSWHMGAVIVKGKNVVGKGHNRLSGDCMYIAQRYGLDALWSLHAEMAALLDVEGSVEGATMFIAGKKKNGRKMYCRPCENRMKVLRHTGLRAVYYETQTGVEGILLR